MAVLAGKRVRAIIGAVLVAGSMGGAVLSVPSTPVAQGSNATSVARYRAVFTGSGVWQVTYESGTAYSASGDKTVYTARFTWTLVFPFEWVFTSETGIPLGLAGPGAGSWVHGGWAAVEGRGGPPVSAGCSTGTFHLAVTKTSGDAMSFGVPTVLTPTGGHKLFGFELWVPLVGTFGQAVPLLPLRHTCFPTGSPWIDGGSPWSGFTGGGGYTSTPSCPDKTRDSRDDLAITWKPSSDGGVGSLPPAHASAASSVTCDTGHAADVLDFPMVDNYFHWSGRVTLTRLHS